VGTQTPRKNSAAVKNPARGRAKWRGGGMRISKTKCAVIFRWRAFEELGDSSGERFYREKDIRFSQISMIKHSPPIIPQGE
jgi:hypothetical protein